MSLETAKLVELDLRGTESDAILIEGLLDAITSISRPVRPSDGYPSAPIEAVDLSFRGTATPGVKLAFQPETVGEESGEQIGKLTLSRHVDPAVDPCPVVIVGALYSCFFKRAKDLEAVLTARHPDRTDRIVVTRNSVLHQSSNCSPGEGASLRFATELGYLLSDVMVNPVPYAINDIYGRPLIETQIPAHIKQLREPGDWLRHAMLWAFKHGKALWQMETADLTGGYFDDISFGKLNLRRADFTGASLRRAIIKHADLSRANLKQADLRGAMVDWEKLKNARLEGAITDPHQIAVLAAIRGDRPADAEEKEEADLQPGL